MRITIDTKADSLEDIKNVILLLQGVVGGTVGSSPQIQPPSQTYSPMSIFSDSPPQAAMPQAAASPDVFSMFSAPANIPTSKPSTTDLLREVSNGDEERIDDDHRDDYEVIPY